MNSVEPIGINQISIKAPRFYLDICDGSERGEYVSQDYILHALSQKHRAINLMYCYYPNDEGWPHRASEYFKDKKVGFAWDYPYDDYFPYGGGLNGSPDAEVFRQIRDIRRHGMDVILTLTIDPKVSDEQLRSIGRDLRRFGKIELRINHEATGNWFAFTKRASYSELGDFFCRASELIRSEAPLVQTIICAGGADRPDDPKVQMEDEFKNAFITADIWSVDKYLALHWGWPYDVAEKGGHSAARYRVKDVYDMAKRTWQRYCFLNGGKPKRFVMAELNADGDVTGPYDQIRMMKEFTDLAKADRDEWFSGFTFYQFRDRGRLGLEVEDPNDIHVGIKQPVMDYYIELMQDPDFCPSFETGDKAVAPFDLRYTSSFDAQGVGLTYRLEGAPSFFELYFEDSLVDSNLMIECNSQWFYKAPGTMVIDLMESFFKKPVSGPCDMQVRIFAPPADGENEENTPDHFTTLKSLPKARIAYGPIYE